LPILCPRCDKMGHGRVGSAITERSERRTLWFGIRWVDVFRIPAVFVDHNQSSRWPRIASLPENEFDAYIAETVTAERERMQMRASTGWRERRTRHNRVIRGPYGRRNNVLNWEKL
jgi:hypothetical protein